MDLDTLVAKLEAAQASASPASDAPDRLALYQQEDEDEYDVHFPNEQDDSDPEFDDQDEGDGGPTQADFGIQYEDDDAVGVAPDSISRLQQSDAPYSDVSMRYFEPGKVQLQYLGKEDPLEINTRRLFLQSWTARPKPYVSDIFLVLLNSPEARKHEKAFNRFESKTRRLMSRARSRSDYITSAYHGTHRACTLGDDPGQTNPCIIPTCAMCGILKGRFLPPKTKKFRRFGMGIYTSTNSDKTKKYTTSQQGSETKAVFLCSVVTGRKRKLKESLYSRGLRTAPPKFDSVVGETDGKNETIVYNPDQIKPLAVIVYSLQKTAPTMRPLPSLEDHGVYTIANDLFHKALHLNVRTGAVVGDGLRGRDNQLWIFEKDSGGWVFRNKAQPDMYLGFAQSTGSDSAIVGVPYRSRTVWTLRKALGNTYRIAFKADKQWNVALTLGNNNAGEKDAVLGSRIPKAHQQMWFFDYVEPWNGPYGSAQVAPALNYNQFPYNPSNTGIQVQTPINNGVFLLVSNRFGNVMDLAKRGGIVFNWRFLNGENQKWIFEQSNDGWWIKSKADQTQYLGVKSNIANWKEVVPVNQYYRGNAVEWKVKKCPNNTVRIHPVGFDNLEVTLRGVGEQHRILIEGGGLDTQIWKLMYLGSL